MKFRDWLKEKDVESDVVTYVSSIFKKGMNIDDVTDKVIKKFGGNPKKWLNAIKNGINKAR